MHTSRSASPPIDKLLWLEGALLFVSAPFLLYTSVSTVATTLALILLPAVWIVRLVRYRQPFPRTPFNVALLGLSVMFLVGVAVTADPELTLAKTAGLLLGFAVWRFLALFIQDEKSLLLGFLAFAAFGFGMVLVGMISANWILEIEFVGRIFGMLPPRLIDLPEAPTDGVHTNNLAGILTLYFPLLLSILVAWRPRRHGRSLRIGAALLFAFTSAVLLATQSRSGWAGAAFSTYLLAILWSVLLPASRLRSLLRGTLILVLGLSVAGAVAVGPDRLREALESPPSDTVIGTLSTMSFRFEAWRWGLAGVSDFPFTGTGLGTFSQVVRRFYPLAVDPTLDIGHVHNTFLQVALDVGLPGLTAYLALLMIAVTVSWRVATLAAPYRPLALGLIASLISVHVFGLADAQALGSRVGTVLWLDLGLITGLGRMALTPQYQALTDARAEEVHSP